MNIYMHRFLSLSLTLAILRSSAEGALSPLPVDTATPSDSIAMPMGDEVQSRGVSRSSGITLPKTPITMNFYEADIRDVLRMLALKSGINIIYGSDVSGNLTLNLDRVPFDQAFQTVLTLKNLVATPTGDRIIRVITSSALNSEQTQAAMFTRVIRLNYANAGEIKGPLDSVRSAASRKGVTSVDSKSNAIVITDTPEGLQQAEELIRELDKRPQQVDIESKIIEVTLDDGTQLGISWQFAGQTGGPNNDKYKFGATDESDGDAVSGIGGGSGGTVRQVLGPSEGGTGVALRNITSTGFTFLTGDANYVLAAQIAALTEKNKVKILSTPHIVTLNNEEAKINVLDQIAYRTITQNGTSSTENVQFVDGGVKLTVKPTINNDRRITMKIKPEVSVASLTSANLPSVSTRNAETNVSVRDGETIAIGGLIKEQDTDVVTGVPLLMDIPLLGYLFKNSSKRKQRTEVIVFVTPRIAGE